MNRYIALLRAVNVGGTGRLPMADLRAMCEEVGFTDVQTYIASGNVVLSSDETAVAVRTLLEERLQAYAGKPVGVVVRTASEMRSVLDNNPFSGREAKFSLVVFFDQPPPVDALTHASGQKDEEMVLGEREIYVYYSSGIGRSKLKIPAAKMGTGRNLNTVAKLAEMAGGR